MNIIRGMAPPARAQRSFPVTDAEAWSMWSGVAPHLFDRMWLARQQGVLANPHGVRPPHSQVWSRPIINLYGAGMGSRRIVEWVDQNDYRPGHFWMNVLSGELVRWNLALQNGALVWSHRVSCTRDLNGTVWRYDGVRAVPPMPLMERIASFIPGHTGGIYASVLGEVIIGLHLRPDMLFSHFHGEEWIGALNALYRTGEFPPLPPTDGTGAMIPVRAAKDMASIFVISPDDLAQLTAAFVQVDFENNESMAGTPQDDWSYRLAILGDHDANVAAASAELFLERLRMLDRKEAPQGIRPKDGLQGGPTAQGER